MTSRARYWPLRRDGSGPDLLGPLAAKIRQARAPQHLMPIRACVAVLVIASGARAADTDLGVVHDRSDYPSLVTPHPALGTFEPLRDPDRPILAFYGGIGLARLGDGQWTAYNITRKADVDYLMRRCAEAGMDRICASFLEQQPPSRFLAPARTQREDLLPYAIDQAHARGIEVYADLPVFAVGERDKPFLIANPTVLTRDREGRLTPHMMSPAYPQVRAYRRAIILEWLARYPVDGVQLDFIRWPYYGRDLLYGYCAHGYDEPLLAELRRRHALPAGFVPAHDDPRFVKIRQEYVSLFIRELREALTASGIDLPIGVYNSNGYGRKQSLRDVCQDWAYWDREKLVDEHHPMFLFDSITRLVRATRTLVEIKRPDSVVLGPIFLAEGFAPEDGFVPTPEGCRDAARRLIKLGCDGIWFCRNSEIEQFDLWPMVKEIGEYSLSRIRAEDFDPMYENLVPNGDFDEGLKDWHCEPAGRATTLGDEADNGRSFLRIDLQETAPVVVVQRSPTRFSPHPAYALRSLGVLVEYRSAIVEAEGATRVVVDLACTNGERHAEAMELSLGQEAWRTEQRAFRVKREGRNVVRTATIRIAVPPGRGTIWLDKIELLYDPLDNPLVVSDEPGRAARDRGPGL